VSDSVVPLSRPDITEREIDAVVEVLRSGWLSIGPHTEAFEAACAAVAGRRHGIAVNSGTSGLHLCVRGLGIGAGDEVITTPFSFISTTNCILFERAKPVFVDIDPESYNMDPNAVESAITPRTKAILPVEVFGNTAHFETYERIAQEHGLTMIEDCCEALGGRLGGRAAGNFGDCGVFAFYPNKQITTGEGGLIVTDSDRLRDLCVSMRNQGRGGDAWLTHARLGYNFRIDEMSAVLGEVQLSRLDEILEGRRAVAEMYHAALADIEGLHLPPMTGDPNASWFVYVIRLNNAFSAADRDAVLADLREAGIGCRNYFSPIHHQPYIQEHLGVGAGDFPITERIADRTIALPFHQGLTEGHIQRVKDVLAASLAKRE